jgi:leucine dehydrogenase
VIIANPRTQKNEALLRAFGRFVDTLGGRYLTGPDLGSTSTDMEYLRLETAHVAGLPTSAGGGGDTSLMTGLGVYVGMKACAGRSGGQTPSEEKR